MQGEFFGRSQDGRECRKFRIGDGRCSAVITDYGASLVEFLFETRDGRIHDVVLGYDSAEGYEKHGQYFGATIGRNSNRVGGASFRLGDRDFYLSRNEKGNNLHSGPDGYDRRVWETEGVSEDGRSIVFSLFSPDGDQGFPGNLEVRLTYSISEEGGLSMHFEAESDQDTLCNLTNHTYFNLNGHDGADILDTDVRIFARQITEVDEESIPTGALMDVRGSALDFSVEKKIGAEIGSDLDQMRFVGGYDHNYVLDGGRGRLRRAAEAHSADSGICLEVDTDLPGLQFYTGNFIPDQTGKGGAAYGKYSGFAMEGQYFPNSMNIDSFETPLLKRGEHYDATIVFRLYEKEA